MQFKAKYRGKNKKLNHKNIKDYESLKAALKKAFPEAPSTFVAGYFEDGESYDVETEDDFEMMTDPPKKVTLYVRHEGQDPMSVLDQSIIRTKGSSILDEGSISEARSLLDEIKEPQKKEIPMKKVKEVVKEVKIESKPKTQIKVKKIQEGLKQEQVKKEVKEKEEKKVPLQKQKPKQQPPVELNGVKCLCCNVPDIRGSRWKCLSCFDFDLCNECYIQAKYKNLKEHKGKKHEFANIEDDTFWKRINYAHSIKRLFNPDYKVDVESNQVGVWLSEEDIAQNSLKFVNQVWVSSAPIAKQIVDGFDKWQEKFGQAN